MLLKQQRFRFANDYANSVFPCAVALLKTCNHPDAQLLASICTNISYHPIIASNLLLTHKNPIANAYGALIAGSFITGMSLKDIMLALKKASDVGHHFSSVWLLYHQFHECDLPPDYASILENAKKAGERDAFCISGELFDVGKHDLYIALSMGSTVAGNLILQRASRAGNWKVRLDMARLGTFDPLVWFIIHQRQKNIDMLPPVKFAIGHFFHQRSQLEMERIFGVTSITVDIMVAKRAVAFYDFQSNAYRNALNALGLCFLRMKICKDMRIYVAKMLWATRWEAAYEEEE